MTYRDSRKAFEEWWAATMPNDPMYSRQAWLAWQASRGQALEEAAMAAEKVDDAICSDTTVGWRIVEAIIELKEQA